MTDLINLRRYDSSSDSTTWTPQACIPAAEFFAMSPDELRKLFNVEPLVAGIRAGALAQIAADAERESA